MMNASLAREFLALPSREARRAWVLAHFEQGENLIWELKEVSASYYHSDPERALRIASLAREAAVILATPWLQGVAHWMTANAYVMLDQHGDAIRHFRQAKRLLEAAGREREIGQMLVGMVFTLAYLDAFQEALDVAREAHFLLEKHDEPYRLGLLAMNMGVVYDLMERHAEALAVYDEAKKRFRDLDDVFNQARATLNQGIAYEQLGRLDEAEKAYRRAQHIFHQAHAPLEEGRAALNLGILLGRQGRFREAMTAFDEARNHFRVLQAAVQLAETDLYESQLLLQLHLFAEAADMAVQARRVLAAQGQIREAALAAWTQGRALMAMGRMEEAHQALTFAWTSFQNLELQWHALRVRLSLAEAAWQQGEDLHRTLQEARELVSALESWPLSAEYVQAWLLLGQAHVALEANESARQAFSQALAAAQTLEQDDLQLLALDALAHLDMSMGQEALARERWDEAMDHFHRWLHRIPGSAYRAAYIMARLRIIRNALHSRLLQDDIPAALTLLSQIESLALGEFLMESPAHPAQTEAWRELQTRLQELKRAWQWRMRRDDGEIEDDHRGPVARTAIRSLETQIDALWRRLNRLAESTGQRARTASGPWRRQPHMPTILYLPANDILWGVVLTPRGEMVAHSLGHMKELRRLLRQWRLHLYQVGSLPRDYLDTHAQTFLRTARRHLQTLHQRYVRPFLPWIQSTDGIQFMPYGQAQGIPFPALYDGRRYLVQDHDIQLAFGLTTPPRPTAPSAPPISLVGAYSMAGQLPFVDYEAQQVKSILPRAEFLPEERLTVEAVRALMPRARFIHLATHARFRDDNPLFSWLQLADGRLTAHDLEGLSLRAHLVVLSACETGRGMDGLTGLPQAFFAAGARALLVSQWRVDDPATGEFMAALYRHPRLLLQPEIALADTIRDILAAAPDRHPYFWAPFILIQR